MVEAAVAARNRPQAAERLPGEAPWTARSLLPLCVTQPAADGVVLSERVPSGGDPTRRQQAANTRKRQQGCAQSKVLRTGSGRSPLDCGDATAPDVQSGGARPGEVCQVPRPLSVASPGLKGGTRWPSLRARGVSKTRPGPGEPRRQFQQRGRDGRWVPTAGSSGGIPPVIWP